MFSDLKPGEFLTCIVANGTIGRDYEKVVASERARKRPRRRVAEVVAGELAVAAVAVLARFIHPQGCGIITTALVPLKELHRNHS